LLSSASTISRSSSGFHPTPILIGYGFFFGWAGVCFGCSGVGVGLCSRTIFPSQENVRADDLLSKLLQIEFDIGDSLFQGFVFVWHMFVPIGIALLSGSRFASCEISCREDTAPVSWHDCAR
jgi:hypothetical protein